MSTFYQDIEMNGNYLRNVKVESNPDDKDSPVTVEYLEQKLEESGLSDFKEANPVIKDIKFQNKSFKNNNILYENKLYRILIFVDNNKNSRELFDIEESYLKFPNNETVNLTNRYTFDDYNFVKSEYNISLKENEELFVFDSDDISDFSIFKLNKLDSVFISYRYYATQDAEESIISTTSDSFKREFIFEKYPVIAKLSSDYIQVSSDIEYPYIPELDINQAISDDCNKFTISEYDGSEELQLLVIFPKEVERKYYIQLYKNNLEYSEKIYINVDNSQFSFNWLETEFVENLINIGYIKGENLELVVNFDL